MDTNGYKRIQADTKDKGRLAQYSVLLYPEDVAAATALASECGLSFSALLRRLLEAYLQQLESESEEKNGIRR